MSGSWRLERQWQPTLRLMIALLAGIGPALLAAEIAEGAGSSQTEGATTNTIPKSSRATTSRPAGVHAFALIGTASYRGGELAFFDGNRQEFKASVHRGEKIGEWTVTTVAFDHVHLTLGTNEFDLTMDKQLRRESAGEWQIKPMTGRFTSVDSKGTEQSRTTVETGPDRRRPPQQFSDAGGGTRPTRTSRRTSNRTNRGGDPTGQ